ncbi:MAG TPA: SCP2 sterol-binding domain-containing protein [Ornithinibacter sp.]|jgi:putative sterol carrier protein|uniref:SCP2 sterol-binding domain-containing protein n=1 Tax=Ornithinibacter sp. TaxID=2862748 RepID=UPI001B64C8EB|nr:SCP2 sterol-binding domain-containing protein [Ornithinibacter sp.]MBP6523861.1 SCP2 sterol-binding domain-containing protein [Dermatophilaceae bacterium]MBU9944218.1 SCP2 sterol-binding domain-containing protein [Dermatophilaceae bacterium]HNV40028.1 SCP2 sterol-binding domain-containing protein [Ornithinibacter sp.]HOB80560.1 SCP2 sterol-binding domain-containing protein [Ornithinibacter sp.]HOT56651.1 SCP2 sterol-binding domain-containing protein [Ornithinibacter sp.]
MPLNPETLASLSPDGMFALIKGMSDADIRSDLAGEHRQEILEKVFAHFPAQFLPDKAGDRNARIDFRITGGPGDSSDTYAVVVENGTCRIEPGASDAPDLSLMLGPVEFFKLITGSGNPAMMFMMGKIKARGDIGLATALANWFDNTPKG